jgi:hypothetical protein
VFQIALVWGTLSHDNVMPFFGVCEAADRGFFVVMPYMELDMLNQWRGSANPSRLEIRDRVSLISHFYGGGKIFLADA